MENKKERIDLGQSFFPDWLQFGVHSIRMLGNNRYSLFPPIPIDTLKERIGFSSYQKLEKGISTTPIECKSKEELFQIVKEIDLALESLLNKYTLRKREVKDEKYFVGVPENSYYNFIVDSIRSKNLEKENGISGYTEEFITNFEGYGGREGFSFPKKIGKIHYGTLGDEYMDKKDIEESLKTLIRNIRQRWRERIEDSERELKELEEKRDKISAHGYTVEELKKMVKRGWGIKGIYKMNKSELEGEIMKELIGAYNYVEEDIKNKKRKLAELNENSNEIKKLMLVFYLIYVGGRHNIKDPIVCESLPFKYKHLGKNEDFLGFWKGKEAREIEGHLKDYIGKVVIVSDYDSYGKELMILKDIKTRHIEGKKYVIRARMTRFEDNHRKYKRFSGFKCEDLWIYLGGKRIYPFREMTIREMKGERFKRIIFSLRRLLSEVLRVPFHTDQRKPLTTLTLKDRSYGFLNQFNSLKIYSYTYLNIFFKPNHSELQLAFLGERQQFMFGIISNIKANPKDYYISGFPVSSKDIKECLRETKSFNLEVSFEALFDKLRIVKTNKDLPVITQTLYSKRKEEKEYLKSISMSSISWEVIPRRSFDGFLNTEKILIEGSIKKPILMTTLDKVSGTEGEWNLLGLKFLTNKTLSLTSYMREYYGSGATEGNKKIIENINIKEWNVKEDILFKVSSPDILYPILTPFEEDIHIKVFSVEGRTHLYFYDTNLFLVLP
jgi:hypothetical protein